MHAACLDLNVPNRPCGTKRERAAGLVPIRHVPMSRSVADPTAKWIKMDKSHPSQVQAILNGHVWPFHQRLRVAQDAATM